MSVGSDSAGGQQAYCSNNDQARYRCARAPAFFFISHQNKAQTPNMGRSGKQLSPTADNAFLYDEKVVLSCEGVHSEWRRDDEAERVGFCDATGGMVDGGTCPFVISNGYAGLFGTCGGRVASTPGSWTFITTGNGGLSPSYGRTNQHSQSPTGNFIYDEPVLVTCDCLHSEWCRWGEDEVLGTCDIENGLLDGGLNPLYIFAFGFNDGTYRVSPNSYSHMKLYSLRFYEGETLVRDFVPWRRGDGVLGLMDLVHSRFFPNAGTGDFTAGPDAFAGAIEAHGAVLSVRSGTIDAVDAEGVGEVAKVDAGEANAAAVPVFPSLSLATGTLSFQNATNAEVVVLGKLTMKGGATLALDCTGETCDSIRPGSVDLTEASASNRVVLRMALSADVDLATRGVKVIASGLQPGDEAKFRATDGTRKFQVVVEDGALYVCHRRGFSMILR